MYDNSSLKDRRLNIRPWLSGTIITVILILIQSISFLWLRVVLVTIVTIGLFLVIQKLSLERRKLLSVVTLDDLTKIGNYKAFQERLRLETQRAQRKHEPLTLILIDLDRFKNYNDSLGHRLGNELLYSAGQVFQGAVRSIDGVYRFGGDEFAIILTETDLEAARSIVKRIQHLFERLPNRAEVTLSMGMAMYREESVYEFFDRADRFLYNVKTNGGNGCHSELSGVYASKGVSSAAL